MDSTTGSTTVLKLELVCRTCLNESNNMKPIFINDGDNICKMLQSCSGLDIHAMDGLPSNICSNCLNKVHISYEFRQLCEISHNALINFMGPKLNGELESEVEIGSQIETTQNDTKLMTEFEIYKCSMCPNQYTLLTQLQDHFINDHPDESYDTKLEDSNLLVINGSTGEVSEGNNGSNVNEIKNDLVEEKYMIFSEPDVSVINFKDNQDGLVDEDDELNQSDEESDNESDTSFGNGMLIYDEDDDDGEDDDDADDDEALSDDKEGKINTGRKVKSSDDGGNQGELPTCTPCNLTFEKKSRYFHHMESQHKEIKLHQCDQCDKKFSRPTHLRRHQVTHLDVKPYPCEQCDKRFSRLDHRNIHMRAHSNIKPYKCDECDKNFTRPEHLRRHRENRHGAASLKPSPPKTEVCEICQKAFTKPKYLQIHMKVHRAVKEWTCKFCQQKFNSKQDHNDHQKVHVNERPFLCSECGLRFVRNDYLVIHMRRHKGEKPYKCKFCGKGFPRATDLTVHERYHTGEKTHLCTICGKGFQRAYNLLVHTRVHTGERPYKCPHCDKSFAQGNDLKAHVRRHTGERFKCDICGDGFIQGYHLTQHKRNQHGIDMKSHIRRVEKFITPMAQQQRVLEQQQIAQEQITNPIVPTVAEQLLQPIDHQDTKSNIPKLTIIPEFELRHQEIIAITSPLPQLHNQQQESPQHQILYTSQTQQQIPSTMHILDVNETIVKMEQIDEINQISTIMSYPNYEKGDC